MTSDEIYAEFIRIMFAEWGADEMAYLDVKVRHPSYNPDNCRCTYCGYPSGDPGCTFCKKRVTGLDIAG